MRMWCVCVCVCVCVFQELRACERGAGRRVKADPRRALTSEVMSFHESGMVPVSMGSSTMTRTRRSVRAAPHSTGRVPLRVGFWVELKTCGQVGR